MPIYWTLKSIPELSDLSAAERNQFWARIRRKSFRHWQTWLGLLGCGLISAAGEVLGRQLGHPNIGAAIGGGIGGFIYSRRLISAPGIVFMLLVLAGVLTACAVSNVEVTPPLAQLPTTEEAHCASGGGTWDKSNFKLTNGYCAKGTPAQCQASGGSWQRVCMMGTLACVQPYGDADKTCRSGTDCQGRRCLQAAEARGNSQSQTGRCIANNTPCYFGINLENGLPVPTAVAD